MSEGAQWIGFTRGEAPGAMPNGTIVTKSKFEALINDDPDLALRIARARTFARLVSIGLKMTRRAAS